MPCKEWIIAGLDEPVADLLRFMLRNQPKGYFWNPNVKATMIDLVLNYLRNPRTSWWGERYVRNGRVERVDDLSMTLDMIWERFQHAECG